MDIDSEEVTIDGPSSPSQAIVMGLAERNDVSPLEMQPLYEAVNPEALDTLFQNGRSGRVTFEYAGYEVAVHGNGHIDIHETEHSAGEGELAGADEE
ncbi:HalOD1 output domain-containing protein [Natrinema sp. 1APR25-10V2]|uniref:HalOD1 output domain-containing protein n=1 Tax=Natrinema sp. 1APR25-10V2 TaxID=2951081 RepID=UPI0028769063|nr:HalOD1 output domain-containing protein [Natrinema sp. 1APR25-10V2]MDS0475457.1 hypothetical protein [Natrinema sp. 1APR25-10V2]